MDPVSNAFTGFGVAIAMAKLCLAKSLGEAIPKIIFNNIKIITIFAIIFIQHKLECHHHGLLRLV